MLAGEQVLVCPACAADGALDALDRCSSCGSTALVKRLGEVSCRACGAAGSPLAGEGYAASAGDRAALADEVAAAVDRVLRGG